MKKSDIGLIGLAVMGENLVMNMESKGFTVGIIPQPNWKTTTDFMKLGRPRLAFLVTAGAMDSMVANYTANNKPRSQDAYSHGGEAGHRPEGTGNH